MTLKSNLAAELMLVGSGLINVRFVIQNQIWRQVAKVTAPGQPLKEVRQSLDWNSAQREYRRLFPERAQKRMVWIRITMIAGIICFVAGLYLIFR